MITFGLFRLNILAADGKRNVLMMSRCVHLTISFFQKQLYSEISKFLHLMISNVTDIEVRDTIAMQVPVD